MEYRIVYYSDTVQAQVLALPDTLAARYIVLTRRMIALGPNIGEPHTKAFGDGLFELRLKGAEGIARVFFCTLVGKRIVMLHSFIKKSERTPTREREVAESRMKEIKRANT
jgi:phage-related protein